MDNLEKLRDEVATLYSKVGLAQFTKTSAVELERLAADIVATAVLVYQERRKARQSVENRSLRRI